MHEDVDLAAVKHAGEQRLLERQYRQHAFLDGALTDEVDDLHAARLAHAVHASNALLQHRRVPGLVHVHHHGGGVLQIEPDPARVGG